MFTAADGSHNTCTTIRAVHVAFGAKEAPIFHGGLARLGGKQVFRSTPCPLAQDFDRLRQLEEPDRFLAGFQGHIQDDGLAVPAAASAGAGQGPNCSSGWQWHDQPLQVLLEAYGDDAGGKQHAQLSGLSCCRIVPHKKWTRKPREHVRCWPMAPGQLRTPTTCPANK